MKSLLTRRAFLKPSVTVPMFAGATRETWRTVDLTALARG